MDFSKQLEISYYKEIATIDEAHKVYLVQHQDTGKIYVKKVLDVYNISVYKYLQESRLKGIPEVVTLYEEDGRLTVIEEYITGISLQEMMDKGNISRENILHIVCSLCDILTELHSAKPSIVHRDIKPSNIIIHEDRLILLDFNAAKFSDISKSRDTVLLGTKGYAAPEQYGFGSSSPRTDIYSVGVLLNELTEKSSEGLDSLKPVISKCMELNPDDRYHSAEELKSDVICLSASKKTVEEKQITKWQILGFRSKKIWKMIVAVIIYSFIFYISFSMETSNTNIGAIWSERLFTFMIFMTIPLYIANYKKILLYLPGEKLKNNAIGKVVLVSASAVVTIFILFIMMFACEDFIFPV